MRASFILTLLILILNSCDKNPVLGQYVYIDDELILHLDCNCTAIAKTKGGAKPLNRFDIGLVRKSDWFQECSVCVDDDRYKLLSDTISNQNKENAQQWLYNIMKKKGIETGDINDFRNSMKSNDDLKWYFEKGEEYKLDVGEDYDKFLEIFSNI